MNATTVAIVFCAVGVVVLVVLWIRVRALETLVSEESERRLEATRRMIETLPERPF